MTVSPERPKGARIVHPDGSETPLELAYDGTDDEGNHLWVADCGVRSGDTVRLDLLPPHTSIAFRDLP